MAKSKSSGCWLKEHFDDQYVKRSKGAGYRSRAGFKPLEIVQKNRLPKPGETIVDLGGERTDLVIFDMAPNMRGNASIDHVSGGACA